MIWDIRQTAGDIFRSTDTTSKKGCRLWEITIILTKIVDELYVWNRCILYCSSSALLKILKLLYIIHTNKTMQCKFVEYDKHSIQVYTQRCIIFDSPLLFIKPIIFSEEMTTWKKGKEWKFFLSFHLLLLLLYIFLCVHLP